MTTPDALPIVDLRCTCANCVSRTQRFYLLAASCPNCQSRLIVRVRKGDKPSPWSTDCPKCGVSGIQTAEMIGEGEYDDGVKP